MEETISLKEIFETLRKPYIACRNKKSEPRFAKL